MKYTILIVFLFLFGYAQSQEKVVFKLGESITEKDKLLFMEKRKYAWADFYKDEKIVVAEDKESRTFQVTIDKPTVILLAMRPDVMMYQDIYLDRSDTIIINKFSTDDSGEIYLSFTGKEKNINSQYNYNSAYRVWQKDNPKPFYKKGADLKLHKETAKEWIQQKKYLQMII